MKNKGDDMGGFTSKLSLGLAALIVGHTLQASNLSEYEEAIKLQGNVDAGRQHYRLCVVCHGPEGWGNRAGTYPQIAGQLPSVLIKQLADIRAGNRDNPTMRPFTTRRVLPDAQAIADIAAYIARLPMTPDNGKGPGINLQQGKVIYDKECAECHGFDGEGNNVYHIPALYGQHYQYLRRQFDWIRTGHRRNADKKMVQQIQYMHPREILLVMDYSSHLKPPAEKVAKENWTNADFPNFHREQFIRHHGR
jgi:cytochrome c553